MNYTATIGEKEVKVAVERIAGSNCGCVDGTSYVVDALQVASHLWSILLGNEPIEVDITPLPGEEFEILINGDCHKFSLVNEQRNDDTVGSKGLQPKRSSFFPNAGKGCKASRRGIKR